MVRLFAFLAAAFFGALFAVGAAIGISFELDGFGTPGGVTRSSHVVGYAALLVGCVAAPIVLWRLLFPRSAPTLLLAAIPIVAVVLLLLGIKA